MPEYASLYPWLAQIPVLFFIFAFGCCAGSFINVLAWRLPRGMGVVRPASRCPKCETKLTWRENFPVLGWLWLRGRCRFCRSRISPEYPIVELLVGVLFGSLYALWFMSPSPFDFVGIDTVAAAPEWTREGSARMWPMFSLMLALIGSLVAMTLIDAKTYTIPLTIPWFMIVLGLAVHPAHALWIQSTTPGVLLRTPFDWTIPTPPDWAWLGAALGAGVGLVAANVLLAAGLLPRSFADYEQWEREHLGGQQKNDGGAAESPAPKRDGHGSMLLRVLLFTGPAIAGMSLGFALGLPHDAALAGMAFGGVIGLLVGMLLRRLVPERGAPEPNEPVWTFYPHARREMGKELLFVAPVLALGLAGWWLGALWGGEATPALWLKALGGSLLGLIVGGGVVWAVRILGSLAFGKEAMGLGDVHMMAGVGAILGWIDPVVAFFLAPFSGIAWTIGAILLSRATGGRSTALPYGPHLALGTLVVVYAKPLIEEALSFIAATPVNLP